jgi:hypothetical protein
MQPLRGAPYSPEERDTYNNMREAVVRSHEEAQAMMALKRVDSYAVRATGRENSEVSKAVRKLSDGISDAGSDWSTARTNLINAQSKLEAANLWDRMNPFSPQNGAVRDADSALRQAQDKRETALDNALLFLKRQPDAAFSRPATF